MSISVGGVGLFTDDIYAVGSSNDSAVMVSMVSPYVSGASTAWKINNITVTIYVSLSMESSHYSALLYDSVLLNPLTPTVVICNF